MKKSQIGTASKAGIGTPPSLSIQTPDLRIASPDSLADSVREALSGIPQSERLAVYDQILAALKEANVNLGPLLLLLGIPAETSDQLTAPEIGKVIRYLRITDGKAMNALFPVLSDLLAAHAEPGKSLKISRQAA